MLVPFDADHTLNFIFHGLREDAAAGQVSDALPLLIRQRHRPGLSLGVSGQHCNVAQIKWAVRALVEPLADVTRCFLHSFRLRPMVVVRLWHAPLG